MSANCPPSRSPAPTPTHAVIWMHGLGAGDAISNRWSIGSTSTAASARLRVSPRAPAAGDDQRRLHHANLVRHPVAGFQQRRGDARGVIRSTAQVEALIAARTPGFPTAASCWRAIKAGDHAPLRH